MIEALIDKQMRDEIDKRNKALQEDEQTNLNNEPIPKQLKTIDTIGMDKLRSTCHYHINNLATKPIDAEAEDVRGYIYEDVITMLYGAEVWAWINKRIV